MKWYGERKKGAYVVYDQIIKLSDCNLCIDSNDRDTLQSRMTGISYAPDRIQREDKEMVHS